MAEPPDPYRDTTPEDPYHPGHERHLHDDSHMMTMARNLHYSVRTESHDVAFGAVIRLLEMFQESGVKPFPEVVPPLNKSLLWKTARVVLALARVTRAASESEDPAIPLGLAHTYLLVVLKGLYHWERRRRLRVENGIRDLIASVRQGDTERDQEQP
jgi:hypothetical protein